MIDLHCHLDLYPDPVQVVEECKRREMYILSVTTTPKAWKGSSAIAYAAPRIKTALGLHPQLAHERIGELALFDQLLSETRYVGEIGLDGTPEFRRHWTNQVHVFEHILASCSEAGDKIMTIHSRGAAKEVVAELAKFPNAGKSVLHWFSGNIGELESAVKLGCWFSIGPAMLNSAKGRKLVSRMPQQRILIETDGPFAKIDGNNLMPWHSELTLQPLSEFWKIPVSEVRGVLLDNLRVLVTP